MATIEKVTLKYQRRINLGDWNSIEFSMIPTIHFEEGDDIAGVLKTAWASCRANVEHAAQPIVQGYKAGSLHGITTQELFLGIPIEMETLNYDSETNPQDHYPGIVPVDFD